MTKEGAAGWSGPPKSVAVGQADDGTVFHQQKLQGNLSVLMERSDMGGFH